MFYFQSGEYVTSPSSQSENWFPLQRYSSKDNASPTDDSKTHSSTARESYRRRSSLFPYSFLLWMRSSNRRRTADKSTATAGYRTGLIASPRRRRSRTGTPQTGRRGHQQPSYRSTRSRRSSAASSYSTQSVDPSCLQSAVVVTCQPRGSSSNGAELSPRQPKGGAVENLGLVCDELAHLESERDLA
jgi:hypothetical protein